LPRQQVRRQHCTTLQRCRCQQPAGAGLEALGAQQQQHSTAAERRKAQLADALQNGVRVVIDCSYAQAAQQWVEQQQRQRQHHQQQQQQQQIWKRSQPTDPGRQQQQQGSTCPPPAAAGTSHQQLPHDNSSDLSTSTSSSPSSSSSDSSDSNSSTVGGAAGDRQLVTGTFIHKEVRSVSKQIELAAGVNKR
jgi:hypothetical protein